ncbi:MAG: Crp/Fnr family transcriptional regulator [Bacteroides sp.]|jgi:CRP-like cAMP-binding protein|nr:Crp/Fnr family transcriptional regulator [Bacteroides sp.]
MPTKVSEGSKNWYSLLTPQQHELVINHSRLVLFRKNETILKQGFIAGHILFLEEGMAKLSVEDGQKITVLKIVPPGSFIGLMCSFIKGTLDFSAAAIKDSKVRLIDREIFEQLIRENGDLAVALVQKMSLDTNKMVHDLVHLSHKNADGAICTVLFQLAGIFESHAFQIPLSRIEIANIVGYSKESVINTLSALNRDKVISLSGKNIEILDMKRLEMIARNG